MKVMRIISIISRIFVGIVFIFSGFVKIVDPLGSTYKFIDYFNAFHLGFLEVTALPFAILMSLAEFVIGISLLVGFRMRQAAWAVLVFMVFFTILTFFLALYNPVSDCGCFGDAWILTNWETFYKNLIISSFVAVIFLYRKKYKALLSGRVEWLVVGIFSVLGLWISIYCYNHLPIIDFRPYKVGTNIAEGMTVPESEKNNVDVYETTLIYKKNGELKEFPLQNLPDSTWQWVETKNKLLKEGYHPPIHNFSLSNQEGSDVTDIYLEDSNYTFLLVSYKLETADKSRMNDINAIYNWCLANNVNFMCLTGSSFSKVEPYVKETKAQYNFYNVDEITLKTMIRSNPGLILTKNSTVLAMWHYNDLPNASELKKDLLKNVTTKYREKIENMYLYNLILVFLLISTLVGIFTIFIRNRNRNCD